MRSRASRPGRGFTLLEVMVSLAIIAGLLVTLIGSVNYHLGIAERHEFITVATMLARNKIAEAERSPAPSQGEFPAPYAEYHYAVGVKDAAYPGVAEVTVVVSSNNRDVRFTELVQKGTVK